MCCSRRLVAPAVALALALGLAVTAGSAPAAHAAPTPTTVARQQQQQQQQLPAPKADIVVDADAGKVLICDNIHEPLPTASTAKIMTALVAAERLPTDAVVPAAPNTASIPTNKAGFTQDARWTRDQMMAATMMPSANDAAYALAYAAAGDLENFEKVANETAKRMGMKETNLNDPAGLDIPGASYKGGPTMSAYDLAIAARNALTVPDVMRWASSTTYDFTDANGGKWHFDNHNKMLPGAANAYEGATGMKTGFTNRAGQTMVATATRQGRMLIAVVLGGSVMPYPQIAALLDRAFETNGQGEQTGPPCGGETLPGPAFSAYGERAKERAALTALAYAPPPTVPSDVPASIPPLNAVPKAAPAATVAREGSGGGGGLLSIFSLRNFFLVVLIAGVAVFFLRRRAVRRQRELRLARRRQRVAALRSGSLPVVDGKYRSGLRTGPPLESHVRVRPMNDVASELDGGLDRLDA